MTADILYLKRTHRCPHCVFRELLSSIAPNHQAMADLADRYTRCYGPYREGEYIHHVGDRFRTLLVVQSGAVKTEILARDGTVDVTGFYLAGDLFGLEAIGANAHCVDAVALKDTWVCAFAMDDLEDLCHTHASLQSEMFALMGEMIRREGHQLRLIRSQKAEQRVLWFLEDLARRVRERNGGKRIREIPLPMRKDDIARYLGLTRETLSRILTRLSQSGLIRNRLTSFEILDPQGVQAAIGQ